MSRARYDAWKFVETRNQNMGFIRGVFLEEQEALRWLLDSKDLEHVEEDPDARGKRVRPEAGRDRTNV